MKIKYYNLTPFAQWLVKKWPLVSKSKYHRAVDKIVYLETQIGFALQEIEDVASREGDKYSLPVTEFISRTDPVQSSNYTVVTIRTEDFKFVVDGDKQLKYGPMIMKEIIESVSKKFAKDLAERLINAVGIRI